MHHRPDADSIVHIPKLGGREAHEDDLRGGEKDGGQDKICNLLLPALQATRNLSDLASLTYVEDEDVVIADSRKDQDRQRGNGFRDRHDTEHYRTDCVEVAVETVTYRSCRYRNRCMEYSRMITCRTYKKWTPTAATVKSPSN